MGRDLSRRCVEPEILDALAPDDPGAIASRRDLARLNAIMFQPGIMAALLSDRLPAPPRRILEIGGGDGGFMLAVARRLTRRWGPAADVELVLLDRQAVAAPGREAAFAALGWTLRRVEADVFDWLKGADKNFDAVTVNLALHHFPDADLARLLSGLAASAPVFAATEPRRGRFPLVASQLVGAIGANDVTRHDAPVSVRAGFAGKELSALWPARGFAIEEGPRGLFTHAFAARREAP